MDIIAAMNRLYRKDGRFGDGLIKPQRLCNDGWSYIASPLSANRRSVAEVAKKIALILPLIILSLIAYPLGIVGAAIKSLSRKPLEDPVRPNPRLRTPSMSLRIPSQRNQRPRALERRGVVLVRQFPVVQSDVFLRHFSLRGRAHHRRYVDSRKNAVGKQMETKEIDARKPLPPGRWSLSKSLENSIFLFLNFEDDLLKARKVSKGFRAIVQRVQEAVWFIAAVTQRNINIALPNTPLSICTVASQVLYGYGFTHDTETELNDFLATRIHGGPSAYLKIPTYPFEKVITPDKMTAGLVKQFVGKKVNDESDVTVTGIRYAVRFGNFNSLGGVERCLGVFVEILSVSTYSDPIPTSGSQNKFAPFGDSYNARYPADDDYFLRLVNGEKCGHRSWGSWGFDKNTGRFIEGQPCIRIMHQEEWQQWQKLQTAQHTLGCLKLPDPIQ